MIPIIKNTIPESSFSTNAGIRLAIEPPAKAPSRVAKIRAIELLPPNGPKPADLRIYNLVSRSDSNITTNSNISELKSLEVWN